MNPYLGHTLAERQCLLEVIGAASADELFEQIPQALRIKTPPRIPDALDERSLMRLAAERAASNAPGAGPTCFLGAGCYDHSIPSVVSHLAGRAEFFTAYTPYQPEASQGMLQAIFEFQSMVCELTAMDMANASLYDGSTALAEAALMTLSASSDKPHILTAAGIHPQYLETLDSYLAPLPYDRRAAAEREGRLDMKALREAFDGSIGALAVQHPNCLGLLEPMEEIAQAARDSGAALIVVFDPISLGALKPPGAYGAAAAVGEGQPLGMPPYFGGESLGLFACSARYMRKAPGRLVGQATDRRGQSGYVLSLQTREQHIRREKATSNICTNQGLNALKAAIAMAAFGPEGLREMAEGSCRNMHRLVERLGETAGARPAFPGAYFKECAVRFGVDARALHARLLDKGFLAGLPLSDWRADLDDALLLCATETKTAEDIERFAQAAGQAAAELKYRQP